ncbi:MAG TPA: ABC transporter permease [Pyrinomonadaceae bacterium]|jgi:putative ABC transport system permease protein|nr:ABC transporter permease [Pyrinomonadaceae bacterium]
METIWRDMKYGARVLLKSPAFAAVAILVTALGIGANTSIFSVVNAVLLRPLPYPGSERLVWFSGVNPQQGITNSNMSVPDFADWARQGQAFDELAGFVTGGAQLLNNDEPERVRRAAVTGSFFRVLGTSPLAGRALQDDDARAGADPVVVLSHGLWQRRFGADPKVVGSRVLVSGKSALVAGVMPAGFDFPAQTELWSALALDPSAERRNNRYLEVVGRLKPGATVAQAQAQMDTINANLAAQYDDTNRGWNVKVTDLREQLVGNLRPTLLVLLGAVAFVLLIGCANVANLLLARATSRRKEIAVRTALGASRARIARQLLTESFLLSLAGGAAGLLLSVWMTDLFVAVSPADSPRFGEIRPDARVFLFTLGVTLVTGLIFGLAPALQSSRADLNETLKEGGRSGSEGGRRNRVRSLLVVAEIALSFMLLAGAGLLVRSFIRLRDVSPGFNPGGVLTMRLSLLPAKYPTDQHKRDFFRQATERMAGLPGVKSAGAVLTLPLGGDTFGVGRSFIREGRPATPEESANAAFYLATPDYFRTLEIPVTAGRAFTDRDTDQSPPVVIINETLARQAFPGENPVGKRIRQAADEQFMREIVGVVGDTRPSLEAPAGAQMYIPYAQDATWNSMTLVVRTGGDAAGLAAAARGAIQSLDKTLPVYNVRTMTDVFAASIARRRSSMLLISAFALVALLLALVGIYGVTAYHVTQRTHEIGVRMALGAQRRDVLGLILGQSLRLTLGGLAVGLVLALALTRLMSGLLYDVKPNDPVTFAAGALLLAAVATLACYVPARRATKVDPMIALRYE